MVENHTVKNTLSLSVWALLLVLASLFVPIIGFLAACLWYAPLIILSKRCGVGYASYGLLAVTLATLIIYPASSVIFFPQFLLVAVVYIILFNRDTTFNQLAAAGLLASALGSLTRIAVTMRVFGMDYSGWKENMREVADDVIVFYKETGAWDQLEESPLSIEQFQDFLYGSAELIADFTPSLLLIYGMFAAFAGLVITIIILKRKGHSTPEITMFGSWKLPWQLVWLVILALAAHLWGDNLLALVGRNVIVALIPLYVITGFSLAAYYLKNLTLNLLWKTILFIIIILNLPVILVLSLMAGLFDSLINLRKI